MKTTTKKIQKILKDLSSLQKEKGVRFAFSYIEMGKTLNDLDADVVHNIESDLASETLLNIIEDKLFNEPGEQSFDDVLQERETMAKLHMFNLFNKNKKFEA
tara:strand:- start:430 stop:735 length:306 start_codon:yes stop_codon:yes gene_type:complete